MIKTMSRLFAVVSVMILLAACSKKSNDIGIAPGQGELTATINLGSTNVNFSASGKQCLAHREAIYGAGLEFTQILGVSSPSPVFKLNIYVHDLDEIGTITDNEIRVVAVLDANNASSISYYYSSKVSAKITKLTNTEFEGTFTADIENYSGTKTGTITNGSFKVRLR